MEQIQPFSAEFEQEIQAALAVPDGREREFLAALRKRILDEPARLPLPRRPLLALPAWGTIAVLLLALAAVFAAVGPQRVLAAVRGWLGYVPGIGFVQTETNLRVLAAPAGQERDGVAVTVEQVVADAQRTVVVFTVEGLGPQHRPGAEDAPRCMGFPLLRTSDREELALTGGEGEGWPSGYRTRGIFPALPEAEGKPILVIPCLDDTRPGAAPEDWIFELALKSAPPDFQPLPVVELSTPTTSTPADPAPTTAQPAAPPAPTIVADPHGIQFQVEKLVELEEGYLLQGRLGWQGTGFDMVGFSAYELQVTDAAGQPIPVEPVQSDSPIYDPYTEKTLAWTIQTESRGYTGPLTLTLPAVSIDQAVEAAFEVDLGASPQAGQTWRLDREVEVAGRRLTVVEVGLIASPDGRAGTFGLSYTLHADPAELTSVSMWDPDNHSARLTSSGGSDQQGTIRQTFNYDYLPTGLRRITIIQVSYPLTGPWVASVDLPTSTTPAVPDPTSVAHAACLTPERLEALPGEAATLPEGLGGRLLLSGPAVEGVHFPTLYTANLDGGQAVTVGSGGWADLSPDGRQVIYTFSDGMHLADLESGQNALLVWAQEDAYHPIWSPDGEWIAFERGNEGIYVARPDGTGLQQAPGTSASTSLTGWMPDGKALVVVRLGAEGGVLQTVNLETGAVTDHLVIDNRKGGFGRPSPDGLRVAFSEKVFGQPAYGVYVAGLDGSGKRLVASLGATSVLSSAWSSDGRWLVVTAVEATLDGSRETSYLVQLDTCEVYPLEGIVDGVVAWR